MKRKIAGATVVITGASSGIGRATALAFAERGAQLVLAGRELGPLEDVVSLCAERGAPAIAVPTDISDEASVRALADAAVSRFGRIDVWVNDAAVYMLGRVEDAPSQAYRRLLEVNVLGTVHGVQAAIAQFRRQGEGGVIVNVGSLAGKAPYAYASAYCASKHAVHAITAVIRQEMRGTPIEACVVAPATVDTPLFQHAANYTGREVVAMPPIYAPERVAEAIVSCAERPRREVLVGAAPRVQSLLHTLLPGLYERVAPRVIEREHLGEGGVPPSLGNLDEPREPHRTTGGWREARRLGRRTLATLVAAAPVLALGVRAGARALGVGR